MKDVVRIGPVTEYTPEIAAGIGRLMPLLSERLSDVPIPQDWLENIIQSPYHDQIVAIRGRDEVIGALCLSICMGSGFGKRAQMEDVIVDPAARGRGIGMLLMQESEQWCRSRTIPFLLLKTEAYRKAAIRLYEKWGAVRITDGQNNQKGIIYRKDFR